MPEIIDYEPTTDHLDTATTLQLNPTSNVTYLSFNVLVQPALVQFWKPVPGQTGKFTLDEVVRRYAAGTIGAVARNVAGAQFASAVAGAPATIYAEMAFTTDVQVEGGTVTGATINSGGSIVPVSAYTPGQLIQYAGPTVPTGFLLCDGSAVSRSTYANLFAAIGTTWGVGNGTTTFNLPDLLGRALVGFGTNFDVSAVGKTDGLANASRSPKHNTTITDPTHAHGVSDPTHFHPPFPPGNAILTNVTPGAGLTDQPGGGNEVAYPGQTGNAATGVTVNAAATGITAGPGGTRPVDQIGYGAVLNLIAF